MCAKKENFLLYNNMYPMIEELTDTEAGQLFKAVFRYSIFNEIKIFPKGTAQSVAFKSIITSIDINNKKYIEKCENNRKKALKRWANIVYDDSNFTRESFRQYSTKHCINMSFDEILSREQELIDDGEIEKLKDEFNCNSLTDETILSVLKQ